MHDQEQQHDSSTAAGHNMLTASWHDDVCCEWHLWEAPVCPANHHRQLLLHPHSLSTQMRSCTTVTNWLVQAGVEEHLSQHCVVHLGAWLVPSDE